MKFDSQLILDGATGTELNRRGVDTGLPLWSANALLTDAGARVLQDVHEDYLRAGADILTTNTFRTHARALAPSGNAHRAFELTRRAVDIARAAIANIPSERTRYVAGSISTLEDCYRPNLVPPDDELRAEHSERVHHLLESGVDVFLIETINSIREAVIIAKLAVITGTPVIVSFVCNRDGRILSGESLTDAARELLPLGVSTLGVNCGATPDLARPLEELQSACPQDFPLIAYGNIGYADEAVGWVNTDAENPEAYCAHASKWPARIIGGCCGTTPAHIAGLRKMNRD
ncbi:MAG: homocysteine S-methyltransferase family protein [Anaerolineaceae bacterium]|nr:MAG: homocysteine S-methyltransferase family protein [Anaerolineaceae bacterium]